MLTGQIPQNLESMLWYHIACLHRSWRGQAAHPRFSIDTYSPFKSILQNTSISFSLFRTPCLLCAAAASHAYCCWVISFGRRRLVWICNSPLGVAHHAEVFFHNFCFYDVFISASRWICFDFASSLLHFSSILDFQLLCCIISTSRGELQCLQQNWATYC